MSDEKEKNSFTAVEDEIQQIDVFSTFTSLYSDCTDEYKGYIDRLNHLIGFLNKEKLIKSWASKDELETLSSRLDSFSILSRYLYRSAKLLDEAIEETKFSVDNTISFYNCIEPVKQAEKEYDELNKKK